MATLHWVLFYADPSSNPPFHILVGISDKGNRTEFSIQNCEHIPDAIEKLKNWATMNHHVYSKPFTLLYPIYLQMMNTDYESTMHQIAWLIKDEADKYGWEFNRVGGLSGTTKENFY